MFKCHCCEFVFADFDTYSKNKNLCEICNLKFTRCYSSFCGHLIKNEEANNYQGFCIKCFLKLVQSYEKIYSESLEGLKHDNLIIFLKKMKEFFAEKIHY